MAMALTQVLVLALVQYSGTSTGTGTSTYTGDDTGGSLEANRRRITDVFHYFLFKIKCLKTYKKSFSFQCLWWNGFGWVGVLLRWAEWWAGAYCPSRRAGRARRS